MASGGAASGMPSRACRSSRAAWTGTTRATPARKPGAIHDDPGEGEGRFDLAARRPDITPRCWLEKPTGSTDVFGRLWWDRGAFTIRTEFYKPEKGRYLDLVAVDPLAGIKGVGAARPRIRIPQQ